MFSVLCPQFHPISAPSLMADTAAFAWCSNVGISSIPFK